MNTDGTERSPLSLPVLEHRIKALRQGLARRQRTAQIRRWVYLIVGIAMLLVSTVALFSLTSLAFKLDAHALTQVGRLEVEKQMPQGRANLSSHLKAEAPNVIKQAIHSLMDVLPQVKAVLLRNVELRLAAVTEEGERLLRAQTAAAVPATRARLDARFPDLSDEEQIEKVVSIVTSDYQKNMNIVLNELYPKYVDQIDRVYGFLTEVCTEEDSRLTRKERIQKEIVHTLLKLMIMEAPRKKQLRIPFKKSAEF